jgi:hypothetical protein
MGELFGIHMDIFKVRLAALVSLTMGECTQFFRLLDYEVWKPTMSFAFPLSEIEHPNL